MMNREKVRHGTSQFPVGYYYVNKLNMSNTMQTHWHPEHEMLHVIKGKIEMTLGTFNLVAKEGDILFYSGETLHSAKSDNCVYECIVFSAEKMLSAENSGSEALMTISEGSLWQNFIIPKESFAYTLASNAFEKLREGGKDNELIIEGLLLSVVGCGIELSEKNDKKPKVKDLAPIKKALLYMDTHIGEKIELAQISYEVSMTPNYFCRYFRKIMHTSPVEYLNILRVNKAKELLSSTNEHIIDISVSCGFNNASYFVQIFKKYTDMTPSEYKRKLKSF